MNASVPPNGAVQLGSVQLPEGRQIAGWTTDPLLWATSHDVASAGRVWLDLHDIQDETGQVPILLGYLDGPDDGRPWDSGELDDQPDLSAVDRLDPAQVIAQSWADSLDPDDDDPEQLDLIAPFTMRFPGLAAGGEHALSRAEVEQALSALGPARIGLVPAGRPADVLHLVGFNGAVNRYGTPAELAAVLRSWETRFGAILLEVGFAHLRLLVQRPPRTPAAAQAAAAEIWSMCNEFWMPAPHSGA